MTEDQQQWIERAVNNGNIWNVPKRRQYRQQLVEQSQGRCAWTGLPLKFDRASATGQRDPLAAVIDHRQPASTCEGHDIVCDYINRMKGCIPWKVWESLTHTAAFKEWMEQLRADFSRTGTLPNPMAR